MLKLSISRCGRLSQAAPGRIVLPLLVCLAVARSSEGAQVGFCQNQPNCLCIEWSSIYQGQTMHWIEVRCPSENGQSGWTRDPGGLPIELGGGGWGGNGEEPPPEETHPGGPLTPAMVIAWNGAKARAWQLLRGDSNCCLNGKPYYTPNECTQLFLKNQTGRTGADLLDNYVVPRNGEGVTGPEGGKPCSQGSSLWTTCCGHSPYVFVCNSFTSQTSSWQTTLVIHELMHVAGQTEDKTTSAGPGDAPTTGEISSTVQEACDP